MGLIEKKLTEEGDIEEEVYEPSTKLILKTEALKKEEAIERANKWLIGLLYPMLAMQKINQVKSNEKKIAPFPLQSAPHAE